MGFNSVFKGLNYPVLLCLIVNPLLSPRSASIIRNVNLSGQRIIFLSSTNWIWPL